jgi:hypothetical protein
MRGFIPVALLATFAACKAPAPEPVSTRLHGEIFDDLPAPKTATYRDRGGESFSFRTSGFRCGRFVYDTEESEESSVRFFKSTMTHPPFSWKLTNEERDVEGAARLTFVKNDDRCTINVQRIRGSTLLTVRVNYRK